ncbi:class I adenylate-forming enzyme family protein [Sphingoaurantiacus capsulatus]|uniref:Class I adenylate-forming enzyme family protein n=1 Tax=Sphingoaurantiacus capsulatus TaxID=1771310 RepID=A0ABV7XAT5_9SPHN
MLSELDKALDATVEVLIAPGAQLEVTTATVRGVDLPVFKGAPPSMREYLGFFLQANADKEFVVYRDERYTFADIYQQGIRIAAAVQHKYGIAKGDRVAIAMRNYPEWIAAFVGLLHLGAVVVPMNAWWQPEELRYGAEDSGTRLIIADEERARRFATLDKFSTPVVTVRTGAGVADELGDCRLEDLLASSPPTPWYLSPIAPSDDATIMYTSGSTGFPKGAVATHQGVVHGAMNYLVQGLAMLQLAQTAGVSLPEQQVMLLNVPLFHITGSVPILLVSIAIGRRMVIMHKWDAGDALKLIEKERATYFVGVPTMSLELMQHPDRDKYDISTLLDIAGGGAARPAEHVERLAEAFPGKHPAIGYGLTETNGVGAGNLRENYRAKPASTGRASKPMVEIKIADDDGNALAAGEIGEVCIRSVANVRGYWGKPVETAKAFTADGWFLTGDLGRLDEDGYLYIVDRKKDIIIRGGENISCQEVEAAIYGHPAVAEACVFGLPDERLGEIVGAVVYLKPGEMVEPAALIDFTRDSLAAFKVPAKLWVSAEPLPKLGSAKIDKVSLRKQYRELVVERSAAE